MKKIGLILVLCSLIIGALTWSFRQKQTTNEVLFKRVITSEYTSKGVQSLSFMPGGMLIADSLLFLPAAEGNTLHIYDLGLKPVKQLHFPTALRGFVNFSVYGDTAYAADGVRTFVAMNVTDGNYRTNTLTTLSFSRVIPLTSGLLLIKGPNSDNDDEENDVFKVVKRGGGASTMTHDVIKKLDDHGMNSAGTFIRGGNGTIYSVSFLNSSIYAFDSTGRYITTLHTIGNLNKEYEVRRIGRSYTFAEPIITLNLAAGADDLLYLYSRVKSSEKKKNPNDGYVDTYSLSDNYVGSLRVKKVSSMGIKCMAVDGDNLYATEGLQLVRYTKQNSPIQ